ncbi:MAG: hypothetical protein ACE5OO_05440, partial [Candidatus Bathyarchaeia archaeon]
KRALIGLEAEGALILKRGTRIDGRRLNRGVFRGEDFVVNATRRFSEIRRRRLMYRPLGKVEIECTCKSAGESVFRPAVYGVERCSAVGGADPRVERVSKVVSMIGLYRSVVEAGEEMRVSGMLEEVVEEQDRRRFRVVVGSGAPGEYLDWLGP